MEFKRCDRCGEEIKPQKGMPNMLNLISKTINEAFNKLAGKPDYIITDKHTLKPADLCPACEKSLEQWMTYGQKIKKIKETVTPDAIIRDGKMYELKKEEQPEETEQNDEDIKFGDF